jgi:hypothetical protein
MLAEDITSSAGSELGILDQQGQLFSLIFFKNE